MGHNSIRSRHSLSSLSKISVRFLLLLAIASSFASAFHPLTDQCTTPPASDTFWGSSSDSKSCSASPSIPAPFVPELDPTTLLKNMQTSIAVAGATGRSGIFTVRQLIQQKYHVAALVRNIEKAEKTFAAEVKQAQENGVSLRFIHCDVSKPESVAAAIVEQKYDPPVRGVISVLGATTLNPWGESNAEDIDYKGVKNVVDATKKAGVTNFALMSSVSITKWYSLITLIGLSKWKLLGENHLRNSGLNYVIVRPPRLTDDVNSKFPFWVRQGDTLPMPTTWMSREDAASAMVHSMNYLLKPENAARQTKLTYECTSIKEIPTDPEAGSFYVESAHDNAGWGRLFEQLKPDA